MASYGGGGSGGAPKRDPVEEHRISLQTAFDEYEKAMAITKPSVSNMAAVSVVYQPGRKNWKVTKEKTDFKTDFPIEGKRNTDMRVERKERLVITPASGRRDARADIYLRFDVVDGNGNIIKEGSEKKYRARREYRGSGRGRRATGNYVIDTYYDDDYRDDIEDQENKANDRAKVEKGIAKVDNDFIEKRNKISEEYNEKEKNYDG